MPPTGHHPPQSGDGVMPVDDALRARLAASTTDTMRKDREWRMAGRWWHARLPSTLVDLTSVCIALNDPKAL